MTKPVLEGDYPTTVEVLTNSIQKFEIYGAYSNTDSNNHDKSPYVGVWEKPSWIPSMFEMDFHIGWEIFGLT